MYRRVNAYWPGKPGPTQLAWVGEAPGAEEVAEGRPFIGASGRLLRRWAKAAGLNLDEHLITNVFGLHPYNNYLPLFFAKELEARRIAKTTGWKPDSEWHWGAQGYVRPELIPELYRLREELQIAQPNMVVALGGAALWALTGKEKITTYQGTAIPARPFFGSLKVVGTFHPAYILRGGSRDLPLIQAALMKVASEQHSKEIVRTERTLILRPTLQDVRDFFANDIAAIRGTAIPMSTDIETSTKRRIIKSVGLGTGSRRAMCIPFDGYWNIEEELEVKALIKGALGDPTLVKLFHFACYDVFWFEHDWGMPVRGRIEDTLVLSHALQPEMPKKLGTLGAMWTNELPWKSWVNHNETEKENE